MRSGFFRTIAAVGRWSCQWLLCPNRCPREAGLDDRTAQFPAAESMTARPAAVGQHRLHWPPGVRSIRALRARRLAGARAPASAGRTVQCRAGRGQRDEGACSHDVKCVARTARRRMGPTLVTVNAARKQSTRNQPLLRDCGDVKCAALSYGQRCHGRPD